MCQEAESVTTQLVERPLGLNPDPKFDRFVPQIAALAGELLARVVNRLVIKEGITPAEAEAMRVEFLHFVAVKIVFPKFSISPSEAVDRFWRAFILFTQDYAQFCDRHFGRFLHHEPNDGMGDRAVTRGGGLRTARTVLALFPSCDRSLWNFCEKTPSGRSCTQCENACLGVSHKSCDDDDHDCICQMHDDCAVCELDDCGCACSDGGLLARSEDQCGCTDCDECDGRTVQAASCSGSDCSACNCVD